MNNSWPEISVDKNRVKKISSKRQRNINLPIKYIAETKV